MTPESARSISRFLLVSILVATATAAASEPSGPEETIERMMAALGGREAIDGLRSLSVEADCTGPGEPFRTRVESFRPGLVYFEQSAAEGTTRVWSTPGMTWRSAADGETDVLGAVVRYFVQAHEFHLLLFELESRFSNHRLGPRRSVEGRACQSIEMEDTSGAPAAVCVADAGGLPLSLEMNPAGAEGAVRITFEDWREIDGLLYFFGFRLTEGTERVFTYSYERVEPDVVAADRFVTPAPRNQREAQADLLELLRRDRRAHLETDATLIASHLAETLVEVSAGRIEIRTRSEVESLFRTLFEGAEYLVWEDSAPPLIRISRDSRTAWVVRAVRVRRRAPDSDGRLSLQTFSSAYTSTYQKQDGGWKMTSVTSTFAPD